VDAKKTIQKILFILLWAGIGAGMTTLLVAAIGKKNRDTCRDYNITINHSKSGFFFDEKDILEIISDESSVALKGRLISTVNLRSMEAAIEKNSCVKDAQLYFSNQDILHIIVHEREPVARIFSNEGNSFYIDRDAVAMPLSDKKSARVPVFTGFPVEKNTDTYDSLLLQQIKETALFILNDPFWMAQVAQIDITEKRNFEMIPTVGNHFVRLGSGDNINEKFHRLFIFYREVLSKTGFEKYPVLDVQYDRQVVAVRPGTGKAKVDTALLKSNLQKLIQQAKQERRESVDEMKLQPEETNLVKEPSNEFNESMDNKKLEENINSQPVKTISESKPGEIKIPKAVMPKRDST
jgi:cell division protein FtsQ